MEKKVEVKTYIIFKICPKCGTGRMYYKSGINTIQYAHTCDKCDYESIYSDCYPKIEYEEI